LLSVGPTTVFDKFRVPPKNGIYQLVSLSRTESTDLNELALRVVSENGIAVVSTTSGDDGVVLMPLRMWNTWRQTHPIPVGTQVTSASDLIGLPLSHLAARRQKAPLAERLAQRRSKDR